MAIQSNASTESVAGGIKLYSGISNFKIVAVNPTLPELHEMGIQFKTEPNYHVEMQGEDMFKLTFWLKNEDITTKMEILLNPNHRVAQTGKFQWMNNIGQETWSDAAPTYDWWKSEGQRKAYVGEETLIRFIKAWANVAGGDEVYFETIEKICSGSDISEITSLVQQLQNNEVRLLLGVKDDKYQQVYTKSIGRVKPQRDDFFVKELNKEYGEFKAEYDPTLNWGPYVPTLQTIKADDLDTVEENADWVS
tara:strand:- start:1237 stop:1986 length:750 start_codon:yes stop_codon:yes gene_type:complete